MKAIGASGGWVDLVYGIREGVLRLGGGMFMDMIMPLSGRFRGQAAA